ncbi:MAG TPA: FtsX-like permease family protein [Kribbella sp.]|uniref:FtsX-like permease family protein n=1 Tax=Kribbella sp. TaxID=1871183 RepID=UPI002D78E548|nr:FtsX-like permease family protein [Kribbella sp.]HET6298495.1 FtsX-like permease family protein [Kribbella sp.]
MFLRQALRYRWSQALVLAGVSLLIGTCAAFAPWFARAVEQTVATETLARDWMAVSWQLEAAPPPAIDGPSEAIPPEELEQFIPADLKPLFTPSAYGIIASLNWGPGREKPSIGGKLVWRDGYCAQLVLTAGRCPRDLGEVVASTADVKNYGTGIGQTIRAEASDYAGGGTLRVVGIYQSDDQSTFWFGRGPTGHSIPATETRGGQSDFLLTERRTFTEGTWGSHSTLDARPQPGKARIDDLDRIRQATEDLEGQVLLSEAQAGNNSGIVGVIDRIESERNQATTIIPLVMVQVALFGVVVLALALAAVVDQRRPELAVSRLRGSGAGRIGRALAVELSVPVLLGMLAGVAAGFALLLVVRSTWLDGGSPIELPWTVPASVALAALVGLAVVALSIRSVIRQPISTLLRRVVPRRRGRAIGMIDLTVIVLASAGLVAALTGGGRGPLPVLTPTLLALAVGLAFAHLLLPAAGLVSRQALRAGRLGLALGALQVSRRPAVTRLVAVVAVATALVSFAGQASSVADRNRDTRAGYEVGAEAVLAMDTYNLGTFTAAVNKVDPERKWLTPVVLSYPPSTESLRALLIEPDSYQRIAFRGDQLTNAEGFRNLSAPAGPAPIELRGDRLTVTASVGAMMPFIAPTLDGEIAPPEAQAKSVILQATVVNARMSARYLVRFPPMPLVPGKSVQLSTPMDCTPSCRLIRLGVARDVGDSVGITGDVAISKLSTETQPSIPLGRAQDWSSGPQAGGDNQGSIAAENQPPNGLTLKVTSTGSDQNLQYATIPTPVPALVSADVPFSEAQTVPGLDGLSIPVRKLDGLQTPVPRHSERVAVMDLETVRRLGGSVDDTSTDFELWLNADGLANVDKITKELTAAGFTPTLIDRQSDRVASFGRSASALALQLTPVVGLAGWALAIIVLLLMVVTSWRSRAQDYASLRITGVPAATTGGAARWEQTGPVALAALLGSACGIVGAHIALPMIPLFAETTEPSAVPLDLATNWSVAVVLWLIGTVALTTTTLLLGTGVNRRAGYSRIREELS